MTNWTPFVAGGKQEVKLNNSISELIVKTLGDDLLTFSGKSQGKKTEHIMDALSRLGREQGFKSMSNRISATAEKEGFKKAEWLYDLHWYEEKEPSCYRQTSLPLVVECEWEWIRKGDEDDDDFSAIKWDFQKLLVANADLRVMIFQQRIKKKNDELAKYFDETIDGYRNLVEGSKFLFIAFDKRGFHYKEKTKGTSDLAEC
ncbi:MAG: hypothetical protein ACLP2Y_02970 [Limisphaerales bacterium]